MSWKNEGCGSKVRATVFDTWLGFILSFTSESDALGYNFTLGTFMPTLDFKGKPFVYSHHLSVPFRELKIDAGKSLAGDSGPSLDDNLIIHGDNLHALKALLPKYAGKVDVIYIDPPYNTGNEGWAYNDNVNSALMKEWLGKTVDGDDLERHDKWCCMMWPRLVLLRELLSNSGFIFVNIDNHEQHRLRMIMDEIFGAGNFRNELITRRGIKNVQAQFEDIESLSTGHDTVLVYSKVAETRMPKLSYGVEETEVGKWDTFWRGTDRKTMRFELFGVTPESGQWRWSKSRTTEAKRNYEEYLESYSFMSLDDFVSLRVQETGTKFDLVRKSEEGTVQYYVPPRDYKLLSDVWLKIRTKGTFTKFPHEKHLDLLEMIIDWVGTKDCLILDSFAGSASTGHAVHYLNKIQGASRKYILVETENYVETLTADRIRKAIKGFANHKEEIHKKGLGGSFTYCDLGDPIDMESFFGDSASMPAYDQLASYIAYTATGEALGKAPKKPAKDWFIGEVGGVRLYLIYKPDSGFMKGHDAALDMDTVTTIAAGNKTGKPSYVFAAAKYMGQTELTRDYDMTFCQLPYAIHRIMGDGVDG